MEHHKTSPFVGRRSDGTFIQRPLSPHLQVYRLPLSGKLSALNRITGILATGGLTLNIAKIFAASRSEKSFETVQKLSGSFIGRLFLIGWLSALITHAGGGVRHILWDRGKRFSHEDINKDSKTFVKTILGLIGGMCVFFFFKRKK